MRIAPALALLLLAPVIAADESPRPPWQWTLEERIAKRLSDASLRERAARRERESTQLDSMRAEVLTGLGPLRALKPGIDGRHEPELFMPFELFNSLVGDLDPTLPDTRHRLASAIRAAGWSEDAFWKTVREALGPYYELQQKRLALEARAESLPASERRAIEAEAESINIRQCALRADALQTVRLHFGGEPFDRFLYGKIAPTISISTDFPFDQEARRLRYLEGGCR